MSSSVSGWARNYQPQNLAGLKHIAIVLQESPILKHLSVAGIGSRSTLLEFTPRPDRSVVERGPESAGVGGLIPSLQPFFHADVQTFSQQVERVARHQRTRR